MLEVMRVQGAAMRDVRLKTLCWTLCFGFAWMRPAAADDPAQHLESNGLQRSYLVHVPAHLPEGPRPLVLVLHGGGGSGAGAAKMTGFDAIADAYGFIVAYPDGTDRPRPRLQHAGKPGLLTWNAGGCCGYARQHGVDDVGYIRALVAELQNDHAIDPKRIYATGISNGGMLAYRLACQASDIFAAVAPVSAVIDVPDCKPAQPVSVLHIHGSADEYVPLDGGVGKKALVKETRRPVQDSIDLW